ncbi:MAG: choice-of-anchor J domain-containing protein [Muribaculaceae bacterium]|nr:choice-of-anchor J domain-containing protein [Muribaculaceae bacterium]
MKKSTLILSGLIGISSLALATVPEIIDLPANFDAWNLNFKLPLEKLRAPENATPAVAPAAKPTKMRVIKKADAETKEYCVAAQKYHKSYQFVYEGGDIVTYNIGVKVDGDKVTISNLFNLEAQSTEWSVGVDYDVVGTYDATAGTITIPTLSNFEEATIAGTIGTYYTEVLACGTVTEDGKMAPADELVFNVVGDFEAITTDTSFGIMNYMNDGSMVLGTQTLYRGFYANLPTDEPKLLAFNDSYTLNESFVGQGTSSSFSVVNVSDADVDFFVECDSDDDTFSAEPEVGTVPARAIQEINVNFLANKVGEYEGMVSLQYEGLNSDPEPIDVFYEAAAIGTPDYSAAVKSGDFTFSTNIEFPFEITTLEDGTEVARSTVNGQAGTSMLNVEFEVPEGNIGVFSWKGESVNASVETGYWYQNAGGYFIDDAAEPAAKYQMNLSDDISNALEFAPGKHSVRFQYEGLYYSGNPANGLYVYDLELTNKPADADAVVIETPDVNFGNFMIKDENGVEGQNSIVIRSKGLNALSVTNITSTSENFTATKPTAQAGLLETIEIPVMFQATEPGQYEAELTIETTAGNVTANVKALARKMADFSSVITEGAECVTLITTDDSFPFEVENGVAYNANSGEEDNVATTSWFQIDYTIPEGKVGYLQWDGVQYPSMPDPDAYWVGDQTNITMSHPMTSGTKPVYPNETDASSNTFASDSFWSSYLTSIPGEHSIRFAFAKNGDGIISEKDRLEISNFRIIVEDFDEFGVEADKTEIEFEQPIYVGDNRYLTATVTLKNTGSSPMTVEDVTADHPFYGVIPDNKIPVQWNNTIQVGVWFYPSEEGDFEGTITFKTSSGDVDVHCYGSTKEAKGILLIGDVENQGADWGSYDADGDGDAWNLGYNLWGLNPAWVHEGNDCFGSTSYNPYQGAIEPDNWLISPVVDVPQDGAMLRWYAASHHHERYAEHYSVYIATPEEIQDSKNLKNLTPVFSETLEPESADEWVERVIDLAEYAGENICVLFRHHDCNGQYVLKVDDIFIYNMEKWGNGLGVNSAMGSTDAVSTETFDINGVRTHGLVKGINVIRTTYSDGTVKTSKLIVK